MDEALKNFEKLEAKNNRISKLLAAKTPNEKIVEEIYLAGLSRFPTKAEKTKLLKVLDAAPESERRAAIEDVYWAVLSSKEFIFNH